MKASRSRTRRAKTEATLARYEAMNPDDLDADQRSFRALAIRALTIELALQDKGLIEKDGWMVQPPVRRRPRARPSTLRRKTRTRRPRPAR
jgi:hypothetical protein